MHPSSIFENSDALAKLAEMNPHTNTVADNSVASSSTGRTEGKRTTAGSGPKIGGAERIGGDFVLAADPAWLSKRLALLESIKQRTAQQVQMPKHPIKVVLPDGKEVSGLSWVTTPFEIASGISKGLANAACVASVRYIGARAAGGGAAVVNVEQEEGDAPADTMEWELWDLTRPLEGDCDLKLHKFDDESGKEVFWHSSAHILGEALETLYGAKLTHGPALEGGFFYDSYLGDNAMTTAMTSELEKKVKKVIDEKQPFERVVVTKEEALELFADNPFKQAIISSKLPEGARTTVYACGPFIDLCRGPHLPNTSRVKAFTVTKTSAALWLGKQGNDQLQRVYGITFPDKKEMTEWKHLQEEAAKRDHRVIGMQQELFFFDELSPGSCFFLPHGCRIYNALMEIIRAEYFARGYHEVVTPNMYNLRLWLKKMSCVLKKR